MNTDGLTLIFLPFIAAAIGYFTNWVAIWMLFRPHMEKRILGLRVPFTPGLIPSRRVEMAERLGAAVAKHLVTEEAVAARLDTPEVRAKIEEIISSYLEDLFTRELGPIESLAPPDLKELAYYKMDELMPLMLEKLALVLEDEKLKKLIKIEFYELIDRLLTETFQEDSLLDQLKFSLMETFFISLEELRQKIDRGVDEAAPRLAELLQRAEVKARVYRSLVAIVDEFFARPIGQLRDHVSAEQVTKGKAWLVQRVLGILKREAPKMVQAIDVQKLVREKVNEMPIAEVERLILVITSRQLRAITWFGALLGFLIGLLQVALVLARGGL
jgi:uncharacterized membrane protein YheB (UPF0754 family)